MKRTRKENVKKLKSVDTQDKILLVAEELFVKKGYETTTMRDINSRANVNLALINYHFNTKEDLYKALLRKKVTPVLELFSSIEASNKSGLGKLEDLVDGYLEFIFSNQNMPILMFREMSLQSDIAKWFAGDFLAPISSRVFSIVIQAQNENSIRKDIDLSVMIPSFIGCIVFNAIAAPAIEAVQKHLGIPALSKEARRIEVKNIILHGILGADTACSSASADLSH